MNQPKTLRSFVEVEKMTINRLLIHLKQKNLTNAEIETVLLIATGLHAFEIAKIRFVESKTVKVHMTNIRSKLACHENNGILKYVLNFLIPNLKPEIEHYLYPHKKNLDPILWAGKLGED